MWNKTQVQNITVLTDYWFQVGPDNDSSLLCPPDAQDWKLVATYSSALWVLIIHALGSYICYKTGMLSIIGCIQSSLQQPKGLQHLLFQSGCHFPKKLHMNTVGNFCNIFFGKLLFQNLTAKPVISETFPNFSSVIHFKSGNTTLN